MKSFVLFFLAGLASSSTSAPVGDINDDFHYLVNVFPGQYDNSGQVSEDMIIDLPPELRHIRFSAEISMEKIPIFPSNVVTFYLQEYVLGQKIYAFQMNATSHEIITKVYSFVDPTKFINAQNHPGILQNLTWSDLIYLPGCDVQWNRLQPDFFRTQPTDKCIILYNGTMYKIDNSNDLTSSYITVHEKWTFVSNGSIYKTRPAYNLTKLKVPKAESHVITQPIRSNRRQLNNFGEIIQALSKAMPVTLYIDLPNCNIGHSSDSPALKLNLENDYRIEGYSISIDTFEYFNSSVFGPTPYFGFTDAPIIRTTKGEMFQLREGKVALAGSVMLTLTWLNPANYSKAKQYNLTCQLQDASMGNSGQVLAVASNVTLTMINNFSQLKTAVQSGYYFRFYVRYIECPQGPLVNAFAGGIIEGMTIAIDGRNATFTKSKLITNYQGSGYVTDIVTGIIYNNDFDQFTLEFVASDDYVQTFKRVYIETYVCPISTSTSRGAVEIYMY